MGDLPKPGYDTELGVTLAQIPITPITREVIPHMRAYMNNTSTPEISFAGKDITHEERTIPGPHGDIVISIVRSVASFSGPRPGIYFIHGGGMIMGNRWFGMSAVAEWIVELGAVCATVEYRLAPDFPHPVPLDDCYAGIKWLESNLTALNIDPDKLMIAGQSAGGCLAAATALKIKDQGGPKLIAQLLMCPMLDDRNESTSSRQYASEGTWSRESNVTGWRCLLGEAAGGENVEIYAAPGRASVAELSGLPFTYIDVGSAEVFRDEDVSYASRLWEAGVQAELHVWPGGFHGFDFLFPSTTLSKVAKETRTAWVRRTLA